MIRPVSGVPLELQPPDVLWCCQIAGEARGEADVALAMAAVGSVPVNRQQVGRWRGWPIERVLTEPWAFSCFNPNDPNRPKLLTLPYLEPISWARASMIAELLKLGTLHDPTQGATHYCTNNLWNTDAPHQWFGRDEIAAGRTVKTVTIGSHTFARAA